MDSPRHHSSAESGPAIHSVGVVIVSFDSEAETLRCVASIVWAQARPARIFVVENNPNSRWSQLGLQQLAILGAELINSGANEGFAAGCNLGIKQCILRGVEFVWLLNPDTAVCVTTLRALLGSMNSNPSYAAFGGQVIYGDPESGEALKPPLIWGLGGYLNPRTREVRMEGTGEPAKTHSLESADRIVDCDYIPGCSLFFRTTLLAVVGYLPESYFLYFEETSWCYRARKAGQRLGIDLAAEVVHFVKAQKMQQPLQVYYYNRSSMQFWSEVVGAQWGYLLRLQVLLFGLPKSLFEYFRAPHLLRRVFLAHLCAKWHFVTKQFGRRWSD